MLKRIDRNQIRVGMYVEALEGAWLSASFKDRRFLLKDYTQAKLLKESDISGLFINTALGLDVELEQPKDLRTYSDRSQNARPPKSKSNGLSQEVIAVSRTLEKATSLLNDVFETAKITRAVSYEAVAPIVDDIARSMASTPSILLSISRLKSKDDTTFLHSVSVCAFMIRFARYLKFKEPAVHKLGMSGLLHDIGKLDIPTEILIKAGTLTSDELSLIQQHPVIGYKILSCESGLPDVVLDVCLHHHERLDGKGYPYGLRGDSITYEARMAAICDVYDAVTSVRPYRAPWTSAEAALWMTERQGYFDRTLLAQFLQGALRS